MSQNVYTDTALLMTNVLTFTPSNRVLVSVKSKLSVQFSGLGSRSVLLRIQGKPNLKILKYTEIHGYVISVPSEGR